tara:strand:+ start:736 stop:903 length:168 start_codon:yes stop_codon:yes gene_type:complete
MDEIKDSVANATTIAGAGAVMIDWNMVMTMCLLATGIILNVARIIEIRRKSKKDQ